MTYSNQPRPAALNALADVTLSPFWLDDPARPEAGAPLAGAHEADLVVIGAGFTGLWTALLAREADPTREVILLEAHRVASGASGRNGGFCSASLTHSFENGVNRWPADMPALLRMGFENLDGIEATVRRYGIDCDFTRSGELTAALNADEAEDFKREAGRAARYGKTFTFLDREQTRARVNSPLYQAGIVDPDDAMLNPARLAWGLRRACLGLGVRLFEGSPVQRLEATRNEVIVHTRQGRVRARRVALATNAFPPLLKHLSLYMVPVYDYVLMTEPLTPGQRESIGWRGREGLGDSANQFHYSQITADGRILWGGYDAIYYWNNGIKPELENRPESFARLAGHFFQTFPQLEGLRFTHAWGGVIDTCSRFTAFWGNSFGGKLAYVLGYTGLGVGASRFGAQVMLDRLDGRATERTALAMTRTRPLPFPPEPFRSPIINVTRWSLDRADQNGGRRNLWLKLLDALGLGYDS